MRKAGKVAIVAFIVLCLAVAGIILVSGQAALPASYCGSDLEMNIAGDDIHMYPYWEDFGYSYDFSKCGTCYLLTEKYKGSAFNHDLWFWGDESGKFTNAPIDVQTRWALFKTYGFHPDTHIEARLGSVTGQILAQETGNDIGWRYDQCDAPNPVVVRNPYVESGYSDLDTCCVTFHIQLYSEEPTDTTTTTTSLTTIQTTIPTTTLTTSLTSSPTTSIQPTTIPAQESWLSNPLYFYVFCIAMIILIIMIAVIS